MKKIIIIFLLLIFTRVSAFMPSTVYDYKIGRIDNVNISSDLIEINFDNFVYYKIWDYLDFFEIFKNRNIFIEKNIEIRNFPEDLKIEKGDIVAIDSYWGVGSSGILKIFCENGNIKSYGTKSKFFGTSNVNGENLLDIKYANDYLNETLNQKIGCEKLNNFFDKDRRFEDLFGINFKYIIISFLYILSILTFLIIVYRKS